MLGLQDSFVAVSGASSGIGFAICTALRAAGAYPLLLARDAAKLEAAAARIYPENGGTAFAYALDITDPEAVTQIVARIGSDHGRLHHAVANAGISGAAHFLSAQDALWSRILRTNLDGVMYFGRACASAMAESGGGAIVNIASIGGLQGKPERTAYAASKGAVLSLTRAMAIDLAASNIRVNAVAPGLIETPMQLTNSASYKESMLSRIPLRRYGQADEVAKSVQLLLSDLASYVTGQTLVVDGGLTARYA